MKTLLVLLALLSASPATAAANLALINSLRAGNDSTQIPTALTYLEAIVSSGCQLPPQAWWNGVRRATYWWSANSLLTVKDAIYFIGAVDLCTGKINFMSPATDVLAATGSFNVYLPFRGPTTNGTTGYLSMTTNFSALTNFTRNNAHFGFAPSLTTQAFIMGTHGSAGNEEYSNTGVQQGVRMNAASAVNQAPIFGGSAWYGESDRTISASFLDYQAGRSTGAAVVSASAAPSAIPLSLFVYNTTFATAGARLCEADIGAAHTAQQAAVWFAGEQRFCVGVANH